jgi:hypothetical protein
MTRLSIPDSRIAPPATVALNRVLAKDLRTETQFILHELQEEFDDQTEHDEENYFLPLDCALHGDSGGNSDGETDVLVRKLVQLAGIIIIVEWQLVCRGLPIAGSVTLNAFETWKMLLNDNIIHPILYFA